MNKIIKKLFAPIAVFSLALGVTISVNNQKDVIGAEAASETYTYATGDGTWITENVERQYQSANFTFLHKKNNSTSNVATTYAELRVYAKHSMEVYPTVSGKVITQIAVTASSTTYATAMGNATITAGTSAGTAASVTGASTVSGSVATFNLSGVVNCEYVKFTLADQSRTLSWAITYTTPSADVVTALSVNPTAKTYFTTDKLVASDFAVTITKNGGSGSSSDYSAKIGTGTGGSFIGTDIIWGTTQPTTANTTIQFKSKYPTVAGGSTYLTADVALTVNAPVLESISVTTQPTKKAYNTNDNFDPTGMVVTALYNNSASATISNSSLSFSPSPLTQGTTTVTISYTEGSVTKTTTVSGLSVTSPTSYTTTLAYPNGAGTTNMTSGNNASSVGLNPTIFEVLSNIKDPDTNPFYIGLNNAGQIRLYTGTVQGSILTVNLQEAFNNYIIKSLTFTFGSTVNSALIKANNTEIHNGALTANGTLTFNHLYASTFSIENKGTPSTQIYILGIEITYLTHEQAAIDFADNVVNGAGNEAEGSCAEAYLELNGIFNALSTESKSFYNASTEALFVNAQARMAYLQAWVAAHPTANPNVQLVTSSRNNLAAVITIGALGLTTILGYYFLKKKELLG